ncbi:MAG TPA: hypothetical protein VGO96_17705 [Pyrinomonadaceae bacterium]|jgi:hypothetical protein|nr:hypothetical protein [Pyrinomonadaceae bacterium]
MSKRNKMPGAHKRCAAVLCAVALAGGLLATGAPQAAAQVAAPQRPTAAVNPRSASVVAATSEVLKETGEIRQLEVLRAVKSGAQSRAEIERMLVRNLDEQSTPAELHASEVALKKLGLVPADFQFRSFLIELLTEQVAGYYEPKTQEFYLADWIDLDGQQPVMAHELTHALQDQHFNLLRFSKWPRSDSDAELAAHALVEGDATLVMTFYVMRDLKRVAAMMKSANAEGASSEKIERAPRAIRESLLFPYKQGMDFVSQVYRRGGWPLISEAYKALPQSSEQILHPEKYFAREAPVKVDLPELAELLGKNWTRLDYDVNGEWSYFQILDEFLRSEKESQKAAAGWGGDRFALYENRATRNVLLAQLTAWDTETDAAEFFDAYVRRTERRYKDAIADTRASVPTETRRVWRTTPGDGLIVMERQGARVAILEGVPEKSNVSALLKKVLGTS